MSDLNIEHATNNLTRNNIADIVIIFDVVNLRMHLSVTYGIIGDQNKINLSEKFTNIPML